MFTPRAGHYSAIENCVPLGLLFCYPTVFYITFPYSIPFSYLSSYVLPTVCLTEFFYVTVLLKLIEYYDRQKLQHLCTSRSHRPPLVCIPNTTGPTHRGTLKSFKVSTHRTAQGPHTGEF